jgi:hypothetical protein
MPKYNHITLIKSTNNTALLHAVLKQVDKNKKTILFANNKSSFLKDSLEKLRRNLVEFDSLYINMRCMFLKENWDQLNKVDQEEPSFINELQRLCQDNDFATICFHRLDTFFTHISKQKCELVISEILKTAHKHDKKVLFTINNKTEIGKLLESILSDIVDIKYEIDDDQKYEHQQLILLNSSNNTKLLKSALSMHKEEKNLLLLSNSNTLFLRESFKIIQKEITDFDKLYSNIKCMFLKDDWTVLDKIYGKPFFIYEIQNLMKDENFSTIYFHRLDNFFTGVSSQECKQMITDIRDFARYYHKKVIFSIDENTELGKILISLLKHEVDYEHAIEESCDNCIKKALQEPVNIVLHTSTFKTKDRRISL